MHHPFERQAELTPNAVAVVSGSVELTYRELDERANQLANALRRREAGPEVRVGICLERSEELIVGLLGILKVGAAYVPLDPGYPRERISVTLQDARAPLLVAQERFRPLLAGHPGRVVWLDAEREEIAQESTARPPYRAGSANAAYLIYTSGSTGRPKGVVIEHRNALALLEWCREVWPAEECAGVLGSTSVCFDMSVFEVFHTLGVGGTLILAENALALPYLPARERVTLVNTVPSAAAELLRNGGIPVSVRVMNLGGEPLPNPLAQGLYALGHVEKVWNLYGPTEDTTYSTFHPVARGAEPEPTVGRAVPGTRIYLLDPGLDPVPVGEAGEVYLAGDGLTRGYLEHPDLTAGRFLPDALGSVPGARMYRVGDLGRLLPNGELEYLGRVDHQVKIRGFRVELGEVESVLRKCPGVGEVVVAAREDGSGDRRLVAYVVGGEELPAPTAGVMREYLRERLPEYMVPAAWVALEKLPRLPNGKLDRRSLPEPDLASEAGREYVAPRTATEERLAEIWAEVLGVEHIGIHDSFFELGGHSLRAAQVITRVRAAFGVELPMVALFDAPTIAELAEQVSAEEESPELPPLVPVSRDPLRALPLSLSQEAIWFFQKLAPGMRSYNFQAAIRFRGPLDVQALERTLTEMVCRHEIFRTTFPEVDGQPVQVIHPPAPVSLPRADLRSLAPAEQEEEVARQMREEFGAPFELARLPLVRWRLLRLAKDEHLLLQVEHHFVHDGWSFGVFLRELAAIYPAFARGEPSPLPELPIQFADFAVWHREVMRGESARADLAYWKEKLTGADPTLDLPTDRPRPPAMSFRGNALRTKVPTRVALAVRASTHRSGATLYMTMLAGFEALLHRYTEQEDFCVGGAVANRSWKETEPLIGMIVNTVAFRARLGGVRSFRELVAQVKETTREGYAHKDVHFGQVVEAVQPERSLSRLPIYQVAFGSHDSPYPDFNLPGLTLEVTEALSNGSAKFELSVVVMPRAEMRPGAPEDEIEAVWEYGTDLFEESTVERMVRHYHALLEAVLADPEVSFREVPLLAESERRQLREWGAGPAAPRPVRLLHELFGEQARRTPEAPAVVHGDAALSYAELDARVHALAAHLRARGVRPELPVGVCLERGLDLVVALLAVFKAGGVYLPLDPAYPADRLAFMLADSGARLVLTTSRFAPRLPDFAGAVVLLDGAVAPPRTVALSPSPSPEHLAYVIYTSGSTGTPKGVMVSHGAAASLLSAAVETFGARPGSRVVQTASLSFDASLLEIFLALLSGATLHVADRETVLSAGALAALLRAQEIELWVSTPPLLELLAEGEFPALRTVSTGGERCSAELAARWGRRRRLLNMYGPTETTIYATWHLCRAEGTEAPPIGRPEAGVRACVLDGAMQPVPVGLPGELYVGGAAVARGYLGRPELTAERFVPDPFAAEAGARLYRSGDRARWRAEGELEFLGRVDAQVKVRGIRIEPGEIEAVLLAYPGVRATAVTVREDRPGRRMLVAYVVAEPGITGSELRDAARRRLPEYMVPAAVVLLEALPLTPTGKVDRRALPAPADAAEDAYVAPRTPTEVVVAGIFAEVLGRERVGAHDDFFELGGHSLLATRAVARIHPAFGIDLPLRLLFEAPTVAELSRRVEMLRDCEAPATVLPPLVPVPRERPLPLSFAQQRLWFIHRLDPASSAYNVPLALRLRGTLDARALERALGEIVRRHEALRTTFEEAGGEPVQVVHPAGALALPAVELSGLAADGREAEARRLVREEAWRPFDLERGPLLRARLVRLAEEDHVLALTMHHVVSDGWSMGIFLREMAALYGAFVCLEPSPLPDPELQYGDFATWQREWLTGEILERQLAWWRERLAGAPPLLDLPTDHLRRPLPGATVASVDRELPREVAERVRALARDEGASPFMVLLAALEVLLSRWSGQDDVVVGTPIAGRSRVETEGLIGFFVNTLAIRADLSGEPTFPELVTRVRETALGAYQHQDLPFERLVEELGVERSLSHTPLFHVSFQVDDGAGAPRSFAGIEVEPLRTVGMPAKLDLAIAVSETGEGLGIRMHFREDLWDASTRERIADAYAVLLEEIAAEPGRRVAELPLLPVAERERMLREWGTGPAAPPPARMLHESFGEQAARSPDAPAVVHGDAVLSYAALDARAGALAAELRARGVGPEVPVGVCLERGVDAVVALLAVFRTGGVYVPLDPAHPAGRLSFMLADSGARLVLTAAPFAGSLPDFAGEVLRVDDPLRTGDLPTAAPVRTAAPENLAWVIYTSGSTGTPKGVMVTHGAAANLIAAAIETYGTRPGSQVMHSASLSFDASLLEIFVALLSGATLHVADRDTVLSAGALAALLREREIELWVCTPPMLELLPEGDYPALRSISLGGDRCSGELAARWSRRLRLMNMYGPTETTIYTIWYPCRAGAAEAPPIGRPVAGARACVLDAALQPAPAGMPGELYVGGAGVARGYLGRPELTAGKFVPDPFGAEAGARLYRTGDRARWRADGELEFLGRVDGQVKIRGLRIEPGEIETALVAHSSVREAVVVARDGASALAADRRLVAYVVPAQDGATSPAELREHLRARLPDYMVPASIVPLDTLPLTPTGKLDRRALPAPEIPDEGYTAPRTPTEEVVAGIFTEVLGAERVGAHDNFFELGGHSLLATRVVSRVAAALGVEVPLRALFEAQSVAELAARVDAERRAGEGVALPPLVPVDRTAALPLSFAQERLWFLHQMDPGGAGYNMPFPRRLAGRLDPGALERALGELARRHEALRTTFRAVDRGAVQVVHRAAPVRIPLADLSGLDPEAREREARRLAEEDAVRPFDLEHGPLLRLALLRLADTEHVMLLCMHHVVSDGWSMGVLFRELFTLYAAFSRGESPHLPVPAVQYGDYAVWQRGWLAGEVLRRQLDWWRERLGGSPPALELPTDRPRPVVAGGRGASLGFRVPAGETRALRALARREGATLYMVTRAALDVLLSRWSGQEDLVVGSPIAGRTRVELEGLIGFFVNTLALRTDLSGDPAFAVLVGRVRETALGAYAHQDLPFERLVEEVAPERSLSHTPLFQVMFALQNAHGGTAPALPDLHAEPFRSALRSARFDLELDLREEGEELVGSLRFRTDLFDPATVERFAAQYRSLLASVGASPGERCSRLRLLPEEETRLLLAYGSGPPHETLSGGSVPCLLAAQAARTPEAVAVLSERETLTYAQLHRRAASLARRLRARGAAGTTVAVCLERGPGILVALLAVWKAGGVYLPLDPGYPAERLAFLLSDSGAELVLTEAHLAGSLPEHGAGVVLLDTAPDEDPGEPEAEPSGTPDELAYLIYTSGSTGTPKGVMVEHTQLAHTLRGALDVLGLRTGDVVAALASVAFDISLLELVAPLLAGATVRIVPGDVVRDPAELMRACADATILHAVPALMRQVVESARGGHTLSQLRLLLVGGDTVAPELLEEMREVFPAAAVRVLYGPTEATIICATYAAPAEGGVVGHPLGHPLPGVRLSVRGPRGETSPIGVPGEVWISGGGVTRGYLDRPGLTAEKFVTVEGERAYRTGDRARWRPDGVLEFLGRTDEQVKVRGFRIEPGEIEAALREQPGVLEAVVLAREDQPGERRLVAYVVPQSAEQWAAEAGASEQVAGWEALFDETYGEGGAEPDPTLNLTGWNSSYTGEAIPREEMREWVERTTERILALRPERVLEVGCGMGLLLFRVAPHVRAYHGTDFSGVALEHVRRSLGVLPQVALSEREAADLEDLAEAGFDTVVINSVAQYFPGVDYLLRVLEGAAAALRPGGRIFVGDVRSLPLLPAFHASVELARAPGDLPAGQLHARVRRGISEEQELVVDPALFQALRARIPRVGRVEVQVKRGAYDNEVSRFRYDVVLHLDTDAGVEVEPRVRDWKGEDVAGVHALFEEAPSALLLRGVPDLRVREHVAAAELLSRPGGAATAQEVRALGGADPGGVPREALFALGEALGRAVEVRPGAQGTLDVLLHPAGGVAGFPAASVEERSWESYANDPQWGRRIRALVPALRAALRARLPEYMLPSAFVVLESFPVTPNGKVDRQALPAPDTDGARDQAYVAPRSALEEALTGIWQEVLGVERVGVHDNFFDLGGHSLLATQLVARIKILRVEVPVRQVFQTPTVAGLAESVVRTEPTPGATEMIAKVLLKLKTMSPEERAAALRAKQTGVGA